MPRKKDWPDSEIRDAFHESDEPVLTTREIADLLNRPRRTVHYRLDKLYEEEKVEKKQVGGRNVVWYPNEWTWRIDDEEEKDEKTDGGLPWTE